MVKEFNPAFGMHVEDGERPSLFEWLEFDERFFLKLVDPFLHFCTKFLASELISEFAFDLLECLGGKGHLLSTLMW